MAVARFTGWESFVHPLPGLRAARSKLGFRLAPAFAGCEVQLWSETGSKDFLGQEAEGGSALDSFSQLL